MAAKNRKSNEVAANLLDQVQVDDALFVSDTPVDSVDQTKAIQIAQDTPAPLPLPTPVVEAVEPQKVQEPAKISGFSALLDHLKAEAMRHEMRNKPHCNTVRSAA